MSRLLRWFGFKLVRWSFYFDRDWADEPTLPYVGGQE